MSAMLSLKREESKTNQNVKVNVEPKTNIYVSGSAEKFEPKRIDEEDETVKVKYRGLDVPEEDKIKKLENEIEVLNLIIQMMRDNPIYVNKLIIADDVQLLKFIQLLTQADDVQADVDDLAEGCISKNKYRKVNAIYVIKDGKTLNLKYDYPEVVKRLKELGINTKIVW